MRASLILETTTDRRVYKMTKRYIDLNCSFCPPNRNENGHWRKPRKKKEYQLRDRKNHLDKTVRP